MQLITEWRWMLAPSMACLILSITLVYLGIHVLSRKVIFVDLALAQIAALANRLGLAIPEAPPRAKSGHRRDRRPAHEILSADQRRRIAEDARIELDLLGYEP